MDFTTQQPSTAASLTETTPRVTGRRCAAGFLDVLVLGAFFFVLAALVGTADTDGGDGRTEIRLDGAPALLWLAIVFLYYFLSEALTSRTLGKALLGLQVVRADGGRPGPGAIAGRTALRVVDVLPLFYGLGLLVVLVTPTRQRIGDLAARTIVTRA
jgi:uncharacterized RDD family membrane protein YckC